MMSDINGGSKSPIQTQVTVTTDPGPNPQSIEIRLNVGYFKTASGIVKLVELVRCLFIILMDYIDTSQCSSVRVCNLHQR